MAIDIQSIENHEIIVSTPAGVLDITVAKSLIREIDQAASTRAADYRILFDTRHVESQLEVDDHWYLAVELDAYPQTFSHKTAIISTLDRFDKAEFFGRAAEFRGFPVKAFTSIETAIDWLTAK